MKCILIPVDFTPVTHNVLSYAADFCKSVGVEKIILFKNFHISEMAKVLPDVNMTGFGYSPFLEELEDIKWQLKRYETKMSAMVSAITKVERCLIEDNWHAAIQKVIEKSAPELVFLGSAPSYENNDSIIAEKIIPFAKFSTIPVLVIPIDAVYRKLKRVLIPTSFENLGRLRLMQKLCTSKAWLKADILILNVDPTGKYMMAQDEHFSIFDEYLKGYHYQIIYSGAEKIVQEILNKAEEFDVQLIMALPGKHSFLYSLTHQSVTETFALNSHRPVLLLK